MVGALIFKNFWLYDFLNDSKNWKYSSYRSNTRLQSFKNNSTISEQLETNSVNAIITKIKNNKENFISDLNNLQMGFKNIEKNKQNITLINITNAAAIASVLLAFIVLCSWAIYVISYSLVKLFNFFFQKKENSPKKDGDWKSLFWWSIEIFCLALSFVLCSIILVFD